MEIKNSQLEGKLRKYRLVIHNLSPSDELVREMVNEELGDGAEVVEWEIEDSRHYKKRVAGGAAPMPQRDTYVTLRYREND